MAMEFWRVTYVPLLGDRGSLMREHMLTCHGARKRATIAAHVIRHKFRCFVNCQQAHRRLDRVEQLQFSLTQARTL